MGEVTALDRTITWLDEVGIVYERAVATKFIPNDGHEKPVLLDPPGTVLHIKDDGGPKQGGWSFFYADIEFDGAGNLLRFGVWE